MNHFSNNLRNRIQSRPPITQIQVTPPTTGKPRQAYADVVAKKPTEKQNLGVEQNNINKSTPTHVTQPSTLTQSQSFESMIAELNKQQNQQMDKMMEHFRHLLDSTMDRMMKMIMTIIGTVLAPTQSTLQTNAKEKTHIGEEKQQPTPRTIQDMIGGYQSTVTAMGSS